MDLKYPFVVPPGHVFVMGDNRENSLDSRSFGPVPVSSIEGKAVFRVFPFSKSESHDTFYRYISGFLHP